MLGADDLPELGTDLVAALAFLDVENRTHFGERWRRKSDSRERERERKVLGERNGQGRRLIKDILAFL